MRKKDYFTTLIKDCTSTKNSVIRILEARGFLFDKNDKEIYLSDNVANEDVEYLNHLLVTFELGKVTGAKFKECYGRYGKNIKVLIPYTAKVELFDTATVDNAINAFCEMDRVSFPICSQRRKLSEFIYRNYGDKVPVKCLEPYIAFMVKSLSACGVITNYSCDGNHKDGDKMIISCDYPYNIWANILIENIPDNGKIKNLFQGITFYGNQFDLYYELFIGACYLYNHRIVLREIKREAIAFATKRYRREYDEAEIMKIFQKNCEELLSERRLDNGWICNT